MIMKRDGKYVVLSETSGRRFGTYATRAEAEKHLRARRRARGRRHAVASALVLALLLALAAPVAADEIVKHSGSIVSIAPDVTSFVLAEVGPWQVRDGRTVITYRTITLTPETEYAIVGRASGPPSGLSGDFVELAIEPDDVYLSDYITIDCRHDGQRLVALKITVIDVPAPPAR